MIQAFLFDLDGTLAHTAPDLVAALQHVRATYGFAPIDAHIVQPFIAQGGRAMIRAGFDILPDNENILLRQFLSFYAKNICQHTQLFPGIAELLYWLEQQHIPWGVVTNKSTTLTLPLLEKLNLKQHTKVIVCGDTLSVCKPHPEPILHACAQLGVTPEKTLMVGDDERDVQAAQAAQAIAVFAEWGYGDHHTLTQQPIFSAAQPQMIQTWIDDSWKK